MEAPLRVDQTVECWNGYSKAPLIGEVVALERFSTIVRIDGVDRKFAPQYVRGIDTDYGIDHDYCPACMDSLHGWIESGECNACGWIQPS